MSRGENVIMLALLAILRKHSDEKHPLTQKKIMDILASDYNIKVERKTVKDNMERLIRYMEKTKQGNIEYEVKERKSKNKKTGEVTTMKVYTNFYYEHDFSEPELRLMIDSLLFSKHIPNNYRKELIEKLKKLSSENFEPRAEHILSMSNNHLLNKQLFHNIAVLDEAITKKVKVSFHYNSYAVDENTKLTFEPRKNEDGTPKEYIINPYQMAATDGRYYLICNHDRFDTISHYRVDRITNITLLPSKRKPIEKLKGYEQGLDLKQYMEEHIYMFSGDSVSVLLRLKKYALNEFIEFFNPERINFYDQSEDEVTARVRVNRTAMRNWALRYALHVKVLSPEDLVEDIRGDIEQAWKNYQ